MIQARHKIELLFRDVGHRILKQNEHFPKNPIKQSNCCVVASCNSVVRFKFISLHMPKYVDNCYNQI
jgi:hypothetical protein